MIKDKQNDRKRDKNKILSQELIQNLDERSVQKSRSSLQERDSFQAEG